METQIIIPVFVSIIISGIGFATSKFSLRTKAEDMILVLNTKTSRMDSYITGLAQTQEIILKCLLALLIKAKDGKVNGEVSDALKLLDDHLIHKSQIIL